MLFFDFAGADYKNSGELQKLHFTWTIWFVSPADWASSSQAMVTSIASSATNVDDVLGAFVRRHS